MENGEWRMENAGTVLHSPFSILHSPFARCASRSCAAGAAETANRCYWRSAMNRVMCVHFPKWPLRGLGHERPDVRDKPVCFAATRSLRSGARGEPRIVLCSEQAARLGIRPGMPVVEALAIEPQLVIHEEDLEKD